MTYFVGDVGPAVIDVKDLHYSIWHKRTLPLKMDSSDLVIEALLNCSICLERFNKPKLLQCGHSFCLDCIEKMRGKNAKWVNCPLCKAKTDAKDGLTRLIDDFRVNQIEEGLQAMMRKKTQGTDRKCGVCASKEPGVTCLQCHKAICEACLVKHKKRTGTAMHTLLKTCDEVRCSRHSDLCSHICLDCRLHICTCCLFNQCCEHYSLEIGEAARKYVSEYIKKASHKPGISFNNSQLFQAEDPDTGCIQSQLLNILPYVLIRTGKTFSVKVYSDVKGAMGDSSEMHSKEAATHYKDPKHVNDQPSVAENKPVCMLQSMHTSDFQPEAGAIPRSDCVKPNADIDMQAVLHGKPPIRFTQVVLDERPGYLAVVARHGYMIVRYNIKQPTNQNWRQIEIFMDGLTSGFGEQADILRCNTILFHQHGWQRYLPELRAMVRDYHIYKLWVLVENYSEATHSTSGTTPSALPYQMDKVVQSDKRFAEQTIIAKCDTYIIRCDFNHAEQDESNDVITIYAPSASSYLEQESFLYDCQEFFAGHIADWESSISRLRSMLEKYNQYFYQRWYADCSSMQFPPEQLSMSVSFDQMICISEQPVGSIIARFHDVIIRHNNEGGLDDLILFHPCEEGYQEEQYLLDTYPDILGTYHEAELMEVIVELVSRLEEHYSNCCHNCSLTCDSFNYHGIQSHLRYIASFDHECSF